MVGPVRVKQRSRFSGLRITRGALIIGGLELGLSLIWLLADTGTRSTLQAWLVPTASNVFERGRVWTLVTGVFLEPNFIALVLHMFVLWMFVSTLERFWGTPRFYRFAAITSLAGTAVGALFGFAIGDLQQPLCGLEPFILAAIVAFGIVYARQPVQLFGVLPLTGRQMMYGILGFLALSIALQQHWTLGASYAAAMIAAAIITSKRWSPTLAWRRWRIARARARLTVMAGGKSHTKPARDEHKWLN